VTIAANIFKQSKDPLLNTGTVATVGDIWIDLNDVPATIKTLVTATGVTAYWAVKKSEILGSEISLSGQTPKSIESDESILFKINGANKFKISSATIPSGTVRIGELSTTTIVPPSWDQLSIANPESEINVTPAPQDAYSRYNITNFSDESGGGFVFKVGDEKLLSLRPLATPRLNLRNIFAAPVEGQIVIGDSALTYDDMADATIDSAKLVVNGNMVIGNSSKANFIAFRGTEGDDIIGHTYIGERVYRNTSTATLIGSELILFKGNDGTGGAAGYEDRIRHIAGKHVFQTWTTDASVAGTFNQIATTSSLRDRLVIHDGGAIVTGNLSASGSIYSTGATINGPLQLTGYLTAGSGEFAGQTRFYISPYFDGLATTSLPANAYIDGSGKLLVSTGGSGSVRAYGKISPTDFVSGGFPIFNYGAGVSSVTLSGLPAYSGECQVNLSSALPDSNYVVITSPIDNTYMTGYYGEKIGPPDAYVTIVSSSRFNFNYPFVEYTQASGASVERNYPLAFTVIR